MVKVGSGGKIQVNAERITLMVTVVAKSPCLLVLSSKGALTVLALIV